MTDCNLVCWTAGWGHTEYGGRPSPVLHDVDIKMVSDDECKKSSVGEYFDPLYHTCAGDLTGKKDSCQGDSGGPIICAENGKPVIRGITSFGVECALELWVQAVLFPSISLLLNLKS